ncbi:DUF1127 domain-containing protein [Algihabitans albus]|uniref:DUF1127 domain-containing protein n=1 Tax=Algihabitans albus TaxID=2164067 RepID=UPI001F21F9C2|nr:DUF1127 domain-containing protein [Algihabitans albus]
MKTASQAGSATAWQAVGTLGRAVGKGLRAWSEAGARRRARSGAVRELQLMSDRALADIGIDRSEIHRVAGDLVEVQPEDKAARPHPEVTWAPPAWLSRGTALAVERALREERLVSKQKNSAACCG